MSATLLYFYATHSGMLTTAAVLTSLYPGVTVVLAPAILHERFSSAQRLGLALCAGAVAANRSHLTSAHGGVPSRSRADA